MTFKSLLVHMDHSKASEGRLQAAIACARVHESHLTGLYVLTEPSLPGFVRLQISADVLAAEKRQREAYAETVEKRFRDAVQARAEMADFQAVRAPESALAEVLVQHARFADLTVLGRDDGEEELPGGRLLPEAVVLASGQPVLLIPYIGASVHVGERVVVAWDGGREATRAINDALPFLLRARSVLVLSGAAERGGRRVKDPDALLAQRLKRHGVDARIEPMGAPEIGIAETLLSRISDEGGDLLVMGAYGHSRLRETVLGGVTRHILQHMTVPVFMSH